MSMKHVTLIGIFLSLYSINLQAHTVEECEEVQVNTQVWYGPASCSVYYYGFIDLEHNFDIQVSPFVEMCLDDFYYNVPYGICCDTTLPFTGTITDTVEQCEEVPHNHDDDTPGTAIAYANVNSNSMLVYDSDCNWNGWQQSGGSRTNPLMCNGQQVALVVDIGYPSQGQCAGYGTASGYSADSAASDSCRITVYRE